MTPRSTLRSPFRRFLADERGAFAVMFGVMAIVLVALGGAVVDYVSLEQARQRAQLALDAAVLALQPEISIANVTDESIRERAQAFVIERINNPEIAARVDQISVDRDSGRLFLGGQFTVPTIFVSLVGVNTLGAKFSAEAIRGSVDLEVAIALDVTGSMAGSRIAALKSAVGSLVDVIVQDVQEPTYSKVALIPYSQAVNAAEYADALRGTVRQPKGISSVSWANGSTKAITNVSKDNPVRVTSAKHGFSNGDWVYIWNVNGPTNLNMRAYQISNVSTDQFRLVGVNGSSNSNYNNGGSVVKCHVANCATIFTSDNHGYTNGQWLYVTNVGGLSNLNNRSFEVTNATANTLQLSGYSMINNGNYTANTGKLHCTWYTDRCTYYRFTNAQNNIVTLPITNCVTDRVTPINDRAPSTTLVGANYPPSGGCPNTQIVPLTDDKEDLHDTIRSLPATGTTAGALGILWAWYALSPNFGYVWPEISRPAPYDQANLLKAAIIMTDGDFNTMHCNGAVSRDSGTVVSAADRINCNAPNGNSYVQSRAYCDAMKADGTNIVVYTVGFGITAGSAAANVLEYCASSASNHFLAQNAADLSSAFEQIADNISSLRLTQ